MSARHIHKKNYQCQLSDTQFVQLNILCYLFSISFNISSGYYHILNMCNIELVFNRFYTNRKLPNSLVHIKIHTS